MVSPKAVPPCLKNTSDAFDSCLLFFVLFFYCFVASFRTRHYMRKAVYSFEENRLSKTTENFCQKNVEHGIPFMAKNNFSFGKCEVVKKREKNGDGRVVNPFFVSFEFLSAYIGKSNTCFLASLAKPTAKRGMEKNRKEAASVFTHFSLTRVDFRF